MLPPRASRALNALGDLLPGIQPLEIRTMKETCIEFFTFMNKRTAVRRNTYRNTSSS
jgi:hypothetical protein